MAGSMMQLLSFSPITTYQKFHPLSGNILIKHLLHIVHGFTTMSRNLEWSTQLLKALMSSLHCCWQRIFNTKNLEWSTQLLKALMSSLHCCWQRIFNTKNILDKQNLHSFHYVCWNFYSKFVNFSRGNVWNQKSPVYIAVDKGYLIQTIYF